MCSKASALFIVLFFFSTKAFGSGYMLFFQPLYDLPENISQSYIYEARELIASTPSPEVEELLARTYQNDTCSKKKLKTCQHGLYNLQTCINPKSKHIGKDCKRLTKKKKNTFFHESVFNRLLWNQFALQLSLSCQKTQSALCQKLSKLHDQYYLKFKQHRLEKLKELKSKKDWDL